MLPTPCEAAGIEHPTDLDGISFLPTLLGKPQKPHEFLYWEIPAGGGQQALRMGEWKGVRQGLMQRLTDLELDNLREDPSESKNVAAQHPEVVARISS